MTTTATARVTGIQASKRVENVRYAIRDLAVLADEIARQGHKILPLNIGDPLKFDFATPPHMIAAVEKAMRDGKNGYAPSLGLESALEAIRDEAERKGIRNVQSVFITAGVSEGVDLCLTALVDPGDNVLTPAPDYPLYSAVLAKLGAEPNPYFLDESRNWEPDLEDIKVRINARTKAIVLINPNNPTGNIYSRKLLEQVAELARQHNLLIIADEIYDKITLDEEETISIASLAPDVPIVTFGGLSKPYLVPGWRVGWGIASGDAPAIGPFLEGVHKLLRARLCINYPQQFAIKPALEGPQSHLAEMAAKLRKRRDLTMKWATLTPRVTLVKPTGAFYAFPKIDIPEDDLTFVKELLRQKHVLVVNGSGFGQRPGTQHFRIVFLPEEGVLARAYQAITDFMAERYN